MNWQLRQRGITRLLGKGGKQGRVTESEKLTISGVDRKLIGWIVFGLFLLWLVTALLPFIVLRWHIFYIGDSKTVDNFKEGLSQLGEYGELFGGFGVLISGLAFVGVVYAIILQVRESQRQQAESNRLEAERQRQQVEQSKTYLLTCLVALSQAYTAIYTSDPQKYNGQFDGAATSAAQAENSKVLEQQNTVLGKLMHYTKSVEVIVDNIRESGDFPLPSNP